MPLSVLLRLVPVCLFLTATWFALSSSPAHLIDVTDDPFRPQPRMDREKGGGMTVTVGRIRKDPIIENGIKYVCLAHNTKLGAAKGALQTAEYLVKNYLKLIK